VFGDAGHPDCFFDGCKNRLNLEEDSSGIPDIENSEIQPSNAELMSHHTSSLAHAYTTSSMRCSLPNTTCLRLTPPDQPQCRPATPAPAITPSASTPLGVSDSRLSSLHSNTAPSLHNGTHQPSASPLRSLSLIFSCSSAHSDT
jgi:hypothetical protein